MKSEYRKQKERMAQMGYYNATDLAKITGMVRQRVHRNTDLEKLVTDDGRIWYKYDNGERGIELYGDPYAGIKKFIPYGFKQKSKSYIFSLNTEVKQISQDRIRIGFHNENGDTLYCMVNVEDIEEIEWQGI